MTQDRIPSMLVAAALAVIGSALVLARRLEDREGRRS
jgi:hypothetical protein